MGNTGIEYLDQAAFYLFFLAIGAGAITFICAGRFYYFLKPEMRKPAVISIYVFIGLVVTDFALASAVRESARSEIRAYLDGLAGAEVTVNGAKVANPAPVLEALRSMKGISTRHSDRRTYLGLTIRSGRGDLNLDLWRDSDDRKEYWVFYPRYRSTGLMRLDGLDSTAFDDY